MHSLAKFKSISPSIQVPLLENLRYLKVFHTYPIDGPVRCIKMTAERPYSDPNTYSSHVKQKESVILHPCQHLLYYARHFLKN